MYGGQQVQMHSKPRNKLPKTHMMKILKHAGKKQCNRRTLQQKNAAINKTGGKTYKNFCNHKQNAAVRDIKLCTLQQTAANSCNKTKEGIEKKKNISEKTLCTNL